jgi:hypothetical protein
MVHHSPLPNLGVLPSSVYRLVHIMSHGRHPELKSREKISIVPLTLLFRSNGSTIKLTVYLQQVPYVCNLNAMAVKRLPVP